MVCPTLISVSLVPGPYCFWASAGWADRAAIAAPARADLPMNIGFLHLFVVEEVWVSGRTLARTCVRPARQISNARGRQCGGSVLQGSAAVRSRVASPASSWTYATWR